MQGALKSALYQAAAILLLASALGLVTGLARGTLSLEPPAKRPKASVAGHPYGLSPQEAKELLAAGAIPLDARRPEDFAAERLPGAINLPAEEFDDYFARVGPRLPPDTPLIAYCGSPDCPLADELAEMLRQMGFTHIHVLRGGLEAWKAAGLEVEG